MKQAFFLLLIMPVMLSAQSTFDGVWNSASSGDLFFEENLGQWQSDAEFLCRTGGMRAWLTNTGLVLDYYRNIRRKPDVSNIVDMPKRVTGHIIRFDYAGANDMASFIAEGKQNTYHNYFIGRDETKWANNAGVYKELVLEDIYTGIDIRYYSDDGNLRYDYRCNTGADISQIRISVEGAENVLINDSGALVTGTSLGSVFHGKILAYQHEWYGAKPVSCAFVQYNDGTVGIETGKFNRSKDLIIDPLIYSTFIGGGDDEDVRDIAVDDAGSIYICGKTDSPDFPTTTGAYDTTLNGNHMDMYVSKISPDGLTLLYSTYIGGSDSDLGKKIAVDETGNVYLGGQTRSADFPVSAAAFDTSFNSGGTFYSDIIVMKINQLGNNIIYSTYLGGTEDETINALILDGGGNALLGGYVFSADFPATAGSYDDSHNGSIDGFITKLNPDGSDLVFGTFLGTSGSEYVYDLQLDSENNIVAAGMVKSADFPVTTGAYDTLYNGQNDVFITKFNNNCSGLVFSTYVGGTQWDNCYGMELDDAENVIFGGETNSSDYPVFGGTYDTVYNQNKDIFISKLRNDGGALLYSSYFGGSEQDFFKDIELDAAGNIIITGATLSNDFPTSADAFDPFFNGGATGTEDPVISVLSPNITTLIFSSYHGGSEEDWGYALSLSRSTDVYIVGYTESSDFPTTAGALLESHPGNDDGFLSIITIPAITDVEQEEGAPVEAFILFQNYPNPFNPSTSISFELPEAGDVSLVVYNNIGEQAAVLVDDYLNAGTYNHKFNAAGLPSGVYFYRLQAGNYVETKKMLLLK